MQYLLVFLTAFIIQGSPDGDSLELTINSKAVVFQSFENGIVSYSQDSESPNIEATPFEQLPVDIQKLVMEFTGWGRVWEDKSGGHRVVADLVKVVSETVILEKTNGKEIVVPLDQLSKADQQYAEARRTLSETALPESFRARIVSIHDGDTVTALLNRRQYKIRISGIDAPETGQEFSAKSKAHLGAMVHEHVVSGVREETDQYGRNICTLTVDGKRVDHEMLQNGLAWHYLEYSNDETRTKLEAEAKANRLNIWSEAVPVQPSEWRRWGSAQRKQWLAHKTKAPSAINIPPKPPMKIPVGAMDSPGKPPTEPKAVAMDHWLNTKGDVRHNSSCRWYQNTKEGRPCTSREGHACGQCGG